MAITKAVDLINPEIMADVISAELENKIRFAPYARIDTTLVGQAGDTITRPQYAYIGAAEDLAEGEPIDPAKLSMTTTKVTVKEAGKAVEMTEQAILTNVDGTLGEAENQISLSIADKLDIDYLETLAKTKLSHAAAPTTAIAIINAIAQFNDEDVGEYILFITPADYTKLNLALAGEDKFMSMSQMVEDLGLSDIVRTNRLEKGTAYVQKQGAVEIVYKKQLDVKTDEDILRRTVVIVGNTFYGTNLFNEGGVVKIAAGA